jgi:predicted dehydrogenase (TIGR03970 family)
VVVGAGSAGCVLAARLTENESRRVVLVEAGEDFTTIESMPSVLKQRDGNWVSDARFHWRYQGIVTPQQGETHILRGRVVGGSGAINGPAFLRGLPEDYDSWGSPLWSWANVLPYFRKLETDLDFPSGEHGASGPVPVRRYRREEWQPFSEAFYVAARRAGFADRPDMNASQGEGVGPIPINNPTGLRMSTALTHLGSARSRPNLIVMGDTLALRVRVRKRRAIGVDVIHDGQRLSIDADEVVVSAGALASPQLLILSGLGPASDVRALGIPVVEDLPGVGANLRDHPIVDFKFQASDDYHPPLDAPQTQVGLAWTAPGSPTRRDMLIQPHGFHSAIAQSLRLSCCLGLAESCGRLRVTSADPTASPSIRFNYMEDAWDRVRIRNALRLCATLQSSGEFDHIVARRTEPLDHVLENDRAFDQWLMERVRTAYHTCGTCRIGDASDLEAVVDAHCRVRGVESLRVVDLSVAPNSVRANPNATAIMIAERAADLIAMGDS